MNSEINKKVVPNLDGTIKEVPQVDITLTKAGRSADAKVVGDTFAEHKRRLDNIDPHFAVNVGFDNTGTWTTSHNLQGAMYDALKQTEVYENAGYMANHWSGENNYTVVGKICIVNFNIQNGLSPAPANAVFVTDLPKPKKSVRFISWSFDNDYSFNFMPCEITTNGELCILKDFTYQHSFAGTVAYQIA